MGGKIAVDLDESKMSHNVSMQRSFRKEIKPMQLADIGRIKNNKLNESKMNNSRIQKNSMLNTSKLKNTDAPKDLSMIGRVKEAKESKEVVVTPDYGQMDVKTKLQKDSNNKYDFNSKNSVTSRNSSS